MSVIRAPPGWWLRNSLSTSMRSARSGCRRAIAWWISAATSAHLRDPYLAKRFPGVRIYSYEPHPSNQELFRSNVVRWNGVTGIELCPEAVTGCGGAVELTGNPLNSGGYTAHSTTQQHCRASGIASLTLDQIFERHGIERCVLLKIDCEGAEYDILGKTTAWQRIDHLRGEFHMNNLLASQGHTMQGLHDYCAQMLPSRSVAAKFCGMSE